VTSVQTFIAETVDPTSFDPQSAHVQILLFVTNWHRLMADSFPL